MSDNQPAAKTGCESSPYCFWAKLLVGVPAIGIIVYFVAIQFHEPMLQILNGAVAGVFAVALAMKIEKLPLFSGTIGKGKDE